MADKTINIRLRQKYDTEANWASKNPVLLAGEMAISSDKSGQFKTGNGTSTWSQLAYNQVPWTSVTGKPTALKNPSALTMQFNGVTNKTYDGSAAQTINITPEAIGSLALNGSTTMTGGIYLEPAIGNGNEKGSVYTDVFSYFSRNNAETGIFKITFPESWTNTMMFMEIDLYNYSSFNLATKIVLGGYNYSGNPPTNVPPGWTSCNCWTTNNDISVRFGHDGNKCCLLIENTSKKWNYFRLNISKFIAGFNSGNKFKTGWSGQFIASDEGISSITTPSKNAYFNADLIDGKHASEFANVSHTHSTSQITNFPTSLKNPNALNIKLNGTAQDPYDGSVARTINITASSVGAAASSHTHNYAGSASAGGPATSSIKLTTARKIGNAPFDGTTDISLASIGAAAASHSHSYLPLSGGTLSGLLTVDKGISIPTVGSNWLSGKTATQLITFTGNSSSSYHPMIKYVMNSGNVVNIGALGNNMGFYGYKKDRTENGTDCQAFLDLDNNCFRATAFSGPLYGNATTATTASKLGTASVGSATKPFYLNAGVPTTTSATVGAINKPMFMNAGTLTACSANVGSASVPVYMTGGAIAACTSLSLNTTGSAAKWTTARNLVIGNKTLSIDGSQNVTATLAEIGAAPATGSSLLSKLAATITLGDGNAATIYQNGATYQQKFEIVDNSTAGDAVFKFSQSSNSGSTFSNLMEIRDDGNIVANKFTGQLAGNATSATSATQASKWTTARTLTIGNTGKSVNGTANVAWTVAEIGAAPASHSHSYLPLSGGTMTGTINSSKTTGTYLAGNQGTCIINSTAGAGAYTMLAKLNSTNGYYTTGVYQDKYLLQYTSKATVTAGTNSVTKSLTLLDEAGNSLFPGDVTATGDITTPQSVTIGNFTLKYNSTNKCLDFVFN